MKLEFDDQELRPLVEAIAIELLRLMPVGPGSRLAYSESEAAELLGVTQTTLRDERLRGRLSASLVGRKIRYSRDDLLAYLARRRWEHGDRGRANS